jgi:hypothetical protein
LMNIKQWLSKILILVLETVNYFLQVIEKQTFWEINHQNNLEEYEFCRLF